MGESPQQYRDITVDSPPNNIEQNQQDQQKTRSYTRGFWLHWELAIARNRRIVFRYFTRLKIEQPTIRV